MKRISPDAVIDDAKRGYRKEKERQKNIFTQYNKLNNYEFPKVDDIDMNRFFCFPKDERNFMSRAAIAIYPVLCLQSDFEENKWFQISQKNIAKKAGVGLNSVAKGIKELERKYLGEERYLEKQKRVFETRHFDVYRVNFIRKPDMGTGKYFIFHKCIIDSGVWAKLNSRAKALYISMRSNTYFDIKVYDEIEHDFDCEGYELHEFLHSDGYRNRKWDVSAKPLVELCESVGISHVNLKKVLEQLENHRLIERVDENKSVFKVYLKQKIREQKSIKIKTL